MKKSVLRSALFSLSVFACSLAGYAAGADAQPGGDTISAVDSGMVPNGPGAGGQGQPGFPPQPASVAPAENATPVAGPAAGQTTTVTESTVTTSSPASAPPSSMTPMPASVAAPSQPSSSNLSPVPQGAGGSVSGTNVMGDSGVAQKHSGTYYDSNAIVPDSELARSGATGPRKVDPALEPGQTFVVVEPGAKASSFEGQYVAATRALKLGRYAAAMEMYEKLYKKNHKDPRILMGLAVAQQGAGFTESAARSYEDLLKIQPNNADAIVNLMGIMRTQYPSVTLKKLMELRNKYPTNPGIPAQIGLVNAEMKNFDDAVRFFEVAASMEPRNSSHVYNMAIVTDQKGDASKAIKLYEQALQLDASYGDNASSLPREQIYDRLVVLRRKV